MSYCFNLVGNCADLPYSSIGCIEDAQLPAFSLTRPMTTTLTSGCLAIICYLVSLGVLCVFKAYSTLFKEILASTDAVFKYFSKPSGVPAARLGHAMAVLGMNLTEDEDPWQHDLLLL